MGIRTMQRAAALSALQAGDIRALIDTHKATFGGYRMATGTTDTTALDSIIPEVWGDLAQAQFTGAVKVLTSGAVIYDNVLEGVPGDTAHFPKWGAFGELEDLSEDTSITPEKMTASDSTAVIKEAGKGVKITDKARLTALQDPETEAQRQFGILAARKLDGDLITAAVAAAGADVQRTSTTAISWAEIVKGISEFGDEWEPEDFAGLFVNSQEYGQLLVDADFIDASKLGAGTSALVSGSLGLVGGLNVFLTNRVAAGTSAILKKNVLGALYKRRPIVEADRDILARADIITTNMHYAVKALNADGIVLLTNDGT